jgi:8-amino-7-oxononanoate synthase
MKDKIMKQLENLRNNSLWREMPDIQTGAGRYVEMNGAEYLNLSSNNYLGLSENELVKKEAAEALEKYGTSSGASRIVTGNYKLYDDLERKTASFKNTKKALVTNSGYAANIAIYQSLAGRDTVVFSDRLNHASIIDGIRLSGAKHVRYKHCDMADLEELLIRHKDAKEKIIATDTVFSMDGDVCPLYRILTLAEKYGCLTVIDEAHATGVFGRGRGYAHELGLADRVDIHMGTFSKALGSFGAYIAADEYIIDYLRNTARPFIFSTSLPPSVVGASVGALKYMAKYPEVGGRLLDAAEELRHYLNKLGFDTGRSSSQIIPVILGDNGRTLKAKEFLLGKGIYAAAVRPPTVPENTARLRLTLRLDVLDMMQTVKDAFKALKEAGL